MFLASIHAGVDEASDNQCSEHHAPPRARPGLMTDNAARRLAAAADKAAERVE